MEENPLKAFFFLVKFMLLLQMVHSINNSKFEAEEPQSELYNRISNIEAQNRHHVKEILLLKTEKVEDRKEIHQLRERVALLESVTFSNSSSEEKLWKRSKRPVRLLPSNVLRPKKERNNDTEEEASSTQKFYGPPTSCDDLKKLGYTLNGYYLIKGEGKMNGQIQIIHCKFYHSTGGKLVPEELIGNVNVKTKSVHFYVQRNTGFVARGVIPFDLARLNEGNAFNLNSGIFTAPAKGIYHFQLSAVKSESRPSISIDLQVNGVKVGIAFTRQSSRDSLDVVSLSASLRLNASDKVNLFKDHGELADNGGIPSHFGDHFTHFSGWLVEEDLM